MMNKTKMRACRSGTKRPRPALFRRSSTLWSKITQTFRTWRRSRKPSRFQRVEVGWETRRAKAGSQTWPKGSFKQKSTRGPRVQSSKVHRATCAKTCKCTKAAKRLLRRCPSRIFRSRCRVRGYNRKDRLVCCPFKQRILQPQILQATRRTRLMATVSWRTSIGSKIINLLIMLASGRPQIRLSHLICMIRARP